jgi:hypothetical protein
MKEHYDISKARPLSRDVNEDEITRLGMLHCPELSQRRRRALRHWRRPSMAMANDFDIKHLGPAINGCSCEMMKANEKLTR